MYTLSMFGSPSVRPEMIFSSHLRLIVVVLVVLCAWSSSARAEVFEVGPSRSYHDLKAVSGKLNPGDTVLLDGDTTYPGGVVLDRPGRANAPIVVRGVAVNGHLPVISGGTNTVEVSGDHYVFENIVLTGGSYRCFFHHADDIVLRRSVVRDCPNHGVLSADEGSGSLLLDRCEVMRCGSGLTHHQIYVASDETAHPGSVFRMQHCYVHDGRGGNNVKSRAERNEIYFNWVEGAVYHELELIGPDGQDENLAREDSDVVGNVLRKKNDAYTVRVGGDGTGETNGRYRFVNNTIIVQHEQRAIFRLFDGLESIEMHNNVLFRLGGGGVLVVRDKEARWSAKRPVIAGSHNWIPSGSHQVPSEWTDTISGESPGFVDLATFKLRPAPDSPLRDKATERPVGPEGFLFPKPLLAVNFEPPAPSAKRFEVWARGSDGKLDIGALEAGFARAKASNASVIRSVPAPAPQHVLPTVPSAGRGAAHGKCGCSVPGAEGDGRSATLFLMILGAVVGGWRRWNRRANSR